MKRAITIGVAVLATGAGALLSRPSQESFPHARHAGLFPSCTACHAGIATGDAAQFVSVTPETCGACHDGQTAPRVSWQGPGAREANNLRTVHPGHPELPCGACHQVPGTSGQMQVQAASFGACKACHAPEADEHYGVGVNCVQCHLKLTEATAMSAATIAAFPAPASHAGADFLSLHGELATEDATSCAVCHARESCTTCHVNGDQIPAIAALGTDPRVAALHEGETWTPPVPKSHAADDFTWTHGEAMAAAPTSCATCHTQRTCAVCHVDTSGEIAKDFAPTSASLRTDDGGPVEIPGHTPNFAVAHGEAAVAALPKCAACHAESYCVDCHDGSGSPSFHPENFVQRHGAEAWAQMQSCSECHSNEAFCRDCHATQGFAQAPGATAGAFHDAQPDWFQTHGRAARQGLDACASCHTQSSCMRCHSAKEGFRVNPHGPDFDADAAKAKGSCTLCHFDQPGG